MRNILKICAALALVGCSEAPTLGEVAMQSRIGTTITATTVHTLEGEPIRIAEALATAPTKPLLVNVWATWCTPCIEEMPSLAALGREGQVQVVAIATDASATTVKNFLRQQSWGPGLEVWFDANGLVTREALGAKGLPVTLLANPQGKVVYATAGGQDWASPALRAKMANALAR